MRQRTVKILHPTLSLEPCMHTLSLSQFTNTIILLNQPISHTSTNTINQSSSITITIQQSLNNHPPSQISKLIKISRRSLHRGILSNTWQSNYFGNTNMGDFLFLMHTMCSTPSYIQALINTIAKTYLKIGVDDFFNLYSTLSNFKKTFQATKSKDYVEE